MRFLTSFHVSLICCGLLSFWQDFYFFLLLLLWHAKLSIGAFCFDFFDGQCLELVLDIIIFVFLLSFLVSGYMIYVKFLKI
ncbi:hypothetical protein GLYMA_14G039700v4 [Glycine max]|uniref:Uncharacterized protein n=1 Tax=Glycine max TaxID=3847 RepID=A0A0R0G8W4_SOYBN|nr:hypothetical protein JHK85_039512 [Glycine max]KAG5120817.1 hypothetical protein JHK84_039157 [Glycine max]KAH1093006.1 hypothetical protein GYH30_038970 [Glycine max]KRH14654.1 hypothetical protein GLYMA_14G039700v4 [Glycine max]